MEYKIKVGISNRHVHLTKEIYDLLFDGELEKRNDLNQVGEFASTKTLTIKVGDKEIPNVRVLGPLRQYNQIEISKKDARTLGVNPPVRRSGDLEDSLTVTLVTPKNRVEVKGLILACRHVHMNFADAKKFGVKNQQMIAVKIDGDRSGIIDAEVKVSENGFLELHVDTDDGNAFLLDDKSEVTMLI